MKPPSEWNQILIACQVKPTIAAKWAAVFADVVRADTFSAGDKDVAYFLGQVLHESQGLEKMEEALSYSAPRLMAVWPSRFPTLEAAEPYARNPRALANFVYGGRMGNTDPDDGWNYRGRCPICLTGKDAYLRIGDLMGQDLVVLPDLLLQPRYGLEAAIHWWEDRIPDSMLGDQVKVRKRVNGGLIGVHETARLTTAALEALA